MERLIPIKQRVDYEETFSPVAMLKSIRILLAIAAHYDYEVWQLDVKTAFLNGYIEEEIFMKQPKGFEYEDSSKVCKLNISIYGLKQASRSWNHRFDEATHSYDFIKKVLLSHIFTEVIISTLLSISRMSSIYKTRKVSWLPLTLL